ncbi:hypothetical protein N7495_005227 [Penicillium taxi]|uniref:uncharacterized protein n=1 Tax=Penicillium taxi TaxID=168475 RepID=UPI00254575FF|nr:uncharacterized protein N7495_005227 [Penicillium taxi]KAJ5893536.1 hypothetical protein N7495_005227 [Penicillium taxi]
MAPKIFSLFKRKKERPRPPGITSSDAIGISDSTCEVNGDIFNRWKLPIPPPEQRLLKFDAKPHSQSQSLCFCMPADIRGLIYIELMGSQRVHIVYSWRPPFQPPPKPKPRSGDWHWGWWHCHSVCEKLELFPDLCYIGFMMGDMNPRFEGRIGNVEWLRLWSPRHTSAIIAMDISFPIYPHTSKSPVNWIATYLAFFDVLDQSFLVCTV